MRKKILVVLVLLAAPIAMAASITGSGLNEGALGSLYCALTGCTFTGAVTMPNQSKMLSDPDDAKFYFSHIDAGDNEVYMRVLVTSQCQIGCYDDDIPSASNTDDMSFDVRTLTVDANSGADELSVTDGATTLLGDFTANAVLYVDNTTDMVGINDDTPTADLDVLGTTRLELVAAAPTCDADTDDGQMYYKKGSNGSGLCICMWDGAGTAAGDYTVKATITFGTFADSDC